MSVLCTVGSSFHDPNFGIFHFYSVFFFWGKSDTWYVMCMPQYSTTLEYKLFGNLQAVPDHWPPFDPARTVCSASRDTPTVLPRYTPVRFSTSHHQISWPSVRDPALGAVLVVPVPFAAPATATPPRGQCWSEPCSNTGVVTLNAAIHR